MRRTAKENYSLLKAVFMKKELQQPTEYQWYKRLKLVKNCGKTTIFRLPTHATNKKPMHSIP
jgi:hypothetical protein